MNVVLLTILIVLIVAGSVLVSGDSRVTLDRIGSLDFLRRLVGKGSIIEQ